MEHASDGGEDQEALIGDPIIGNLNRTGATARPKYSCSGRITTARPDSTIVRFRSGFGRLVVISLILELLHPI